MKKDQLGCNLAGLVLEIANGYCDNILLTN